MVWHNVVLLWRDPRTRHAKYSAAFMDEVYSLGFNDEASPVSDRTWPWAYLVLRKRKSLFPGSMVSTFV